MDTKQEIINMLDAFAANSFLVPSTYTDFRQLTDLDASFRTYVNSDRTYIVVNIRGSDYTHEFTANKATGKDWAIAGGNLLACKSVNAQLAEHYKWLKAIYDEVYSLNDAKIGNMKRQVRSQISEEQAKITQAKAAIDRLKKSLEDSNNL